MYYFFNNGAETTTTTGTGTVTLSGTGVTLDDSSTGETVPAAADGETLSYYIESGTAWEQGYGTYTNTGRTLTRNLENSSTGSLISLTGTSNVHFGDSALLAEINHKSSRGYIEGLELDYNAGTVKMLRGYAVVNGKVLTIGSAGSTTVSGDALSGTAVYYYYIYDNSGTTQMHRESRGSGSDDPVWDYDLDYAKHPVDGAAKRCIGALYVGATTAGVIDEFTFISKGRERYYYPVKRIGRPVSAGTATTSTSVDCSALMPAVSISKQVGFKLHCKNASIGSTAVVRILFGQDSTAVTNQDSLQVSGEMDDASQSAALGPMMQPTVSTTFYYRVVTSGTDGFVDVVKWEMLV